MTLKALVVAFLILATIWSQIHGQDQKKDGKKSEDLETQASVLGYGNYADLNDVYNGELYGRYPGYYTGLGTDYGGYYAPPNGLGTSGLGYNNLGYGGLGFPGVYPGYGSYGNLGGSGGYYNRPGYY